MLISFSVLIVAIVCVVVFPSRMCGTEGEDNYVSEFLQVTLPWETGQTQHSPVPFLLRRLISDVTVCCSCHRLLSQI